MVSFIQVAAPNNAFVLTKDQINLKRQGHFGQYLLYIKAFVLFLSSLYGFSKTF